MTAKILKFTHNNDMICKYMSLGDYVKIECPTKVIIVGNDNDKGVQITYRLSDNHKNIISWMPLDLFNAIKDHNEVTKLLF